jgi:dGTPase
MLEDEGLDADRRVPEPPSRSGRGPYQRDRARVLHSGALRRLAGKTQVVEPGSTSVPRTRLTHSLECAQIGRELGAALGCAPDLTDAACLAHDLGHPPYGHNGETALDEAAAGCGGFEGNAQSLRLLTRLEVKVPGAGLNLTRATLDAATKYPWPKREGTSKYGVYDDDLPVFHWLREGAPEGRRSLETQVMDWADDVAYSVHDLEDGVVAGLIDLRALAADSSDIAHLAALQYSDASASDIEAALGELLAEPWWPRAYDGSTGSQIALKAATSTLIGRFCRAAEAATAEKHGEGPLRRYRADLVVPLQARAECAALKAVTARYVMSRAGVVQIQERERQVVSELVALLAERAPAHLEPSYAESWAEAHDDPARLRVVVDQVAGLTDAAAVALHTRLGGS